MIIKVLPKIIVPVSLAMIIGTTAIVTTRASEVSSNVTSESVTVPSSVDNSVQDNNGSTSLTANDLSDMWDQQVKQLQSVNLNDLSNITSLDSDNNVLNTIYKNFKSQLSSFGNSTDVDSRDSKSSVFAKGYSVNIQKYFKNTFGNLSSKKNMKMSKLPSIKFLMSSSTKERNKLVKDFTSSSSYKNAYNMINVGSVFKLASNGTSKYTLSSPSNLKNSMGITSNDKSNSIKSSYDKNASNMNGDLQKLLKSATGTEDLVGPTNVKNSFDSSVSKNKKSMEIQKNVGTGNTPVHRQSNPFTFDPNFNILDNIGDNK